MGSGRQTKAAQARNFDTLNHVVAPTSFDGHLRFLNYGYAVLPGELPAGPRLGRFFPNPDSAQMLFQLVGAHDLAGLDVVDVGCGRGGNLWLLGQHHELRSATGIDLAESSVRLVHERLGNAGAIVGDAEDLPLADACADVVVSVETSCAYPDLERFHAEVARILRPGGLFLYADLLPTAVGDPALDALEARGFEAEVRRDITANVLVARANRAGRQAAVFEASDPTRAGLVDEYLGTATSGFATALEDGRRTYHLARYRRLDAPTVTGPLLADDLRALAAEGAAETAALLDPGDAAMPSGADA